MHSNDINVSAAELGNWSIYDYRARIQLVYIYYQESFGAMCKSVNDQESFGAKCKIAFLCISL